MAASRPQAITRLLVVLVAAACLIHAAPARAADPLLMFLLGFAKNLIESSLQEQQKSARRQEQQQQQPAPRVEPSLPLPLTKPAASMDEADLRALVDESFAYLSRGQRTELLVGLNKALSDPANSGYREAILNQFVGVARQVQFTHGQLDRLSPDEKRAVAERFAANYKTLKPEQQQALAAQLRLRALPVPSDLNDMMLAAMDNAR